LPVGAEIAEFLIRGQAMAEHIAQLSYALSPSQTRSFLENSLPAAATGLNLQQIICTTTEAFDLPRFREAWQTVANRHVALGVAFRRDDRQQPYQRFWPPVHVPISFEERGEKTTHEQTVFIESWLEQDRRHLFDLAQPPLTRISAFRFSDRSVAWIWTFHQILMDGRSALLVLEDFFACYESLCAGRPVLLPDRRPFSEFVDWHEMWTEEHATTDRAFWDRLITNHEIDSMLSVKRSQAAADSAQHKLAFRPDGTAQAALIRWSESSGLSLKTIILGAWGVLLSRYYRSSSVTFGTLRFCRKGSIAGTGDMVGPLTNYLPVHADLAPNPSVLDFLRTLQDQQAATRDHRWTSPDVIRSFLPSAASKQLFESCVVHQRIDPQRELNARLGNGGQRSFSIRERPGIPLLLASNEDPQLEFELIYQPGLFEETEIRQLVRCFVTLLCQLPDRPNAALGELTLLSDEDQANRVGVLVGPRIDVPPDKGLHEWFEEQARRTPDEIAIHAENELTYAQLDHCATQLARHLVSMKLEPDRLVAVFLPRSSALLIAILGILKSGAAYLPIDVELPAARLKKLLEEANVAAIVTEPALAPALRAPLAPIVFVGANSGEATAPACGPLPRVSGSRLAYAISTSGTTGRPKLIGVEHRQAANLLAFATQKILQPEDVRCVPFIDSPSFDSSISQIFTTLALGGMLVRVSDLSGLRLSPFLEKFTCLGTTPSLLATILKTKGLPPAVRLIGLGAEAIPPDLLEKLDGLPQIQRVINYYGPTETTVYCTVSIVIDRTDADYVVDLRQRGRIIGKPIANTRAYVVDDFGHLVPPGAPGELHIAGEAVARGYLNTAETGAETAAFQLDLFQPNSGERLYRTGDIVCLRADGQLEFHGRKDRQLKCNGVRIEAAEIENALQDFPGIHQAAVDVRTDALGGQRLVAYLAAEEKTIPRQELKKALRLHLPDAMIPHHFDFLASLPVTSNGKVDRAALSCLELDSSAERETAAPATPMEKEMAALWERNLSRRSVGLNQDYFEMGGDSLSAVNLVAAIEKQFGFKLKTSALFDHSTVADLLSSFKNPLVAPEGGTSIPTCELISLQDSGRGVPLVVLAGGTGSALVHYRNFASKFTPDHPVYALQDPYALLLEKPEHPLPHLASHVADQVLKVVQDRPFVLFGHCIGGLLAWHVAGILKARNAPHFSLILYAPPAVQQGMNITEDLQETASKSRLSLLLKAYRPAWEEWRMDHGTAWWTNLTFARWVLTNALERRGWIRTEEDRFRFLKLSYLRLLQNSPLEFLAGDALLIYHQEEEEIVAKSLWPELCDQLLIEYIPGHHRVWQTSILSLLPLVRDRLRSMAAGESSIA
jgi:amino acid adenylation domain-containing protein